MIKLTKSIVGTDAQLIGFILEGKEKEFGGVSNNKTERAYSIQNLKQIKFKNNQISCVGDQIVTHNNFKISSLPMCVFTGTDYVDIDNTVNLTKRFVENNENIGFEVTFADGSKKNLTYEAVGYLTSFYKPGNFVIRTSSTNKYFISGKAGVMKLSDLPVEILGEAPKAKRTKSGAKDSDTRNNSDTNKFDILDIYDFIEASGGCVIRLQSQEYERKSDSEDKTEEILRAGFKPFNIGEVASSKIRFNDVKLNVNAPFKQPGSVNVHMSDGVSFPVTTYVHKIKSIFYNGENNMKQFGIALPAEMHDELMKTLGSSLAIIETTDPTLINPFNFLINSDKQLRYYTVDTHNLNLISPKRRETCILSEKEIAKLAKEKFYYNILTKALNNRTGFLKELKETCGEDFNNHAANKKLAPAFVTMNKDALEACARAGLNVFNGEFNYNKVEVDKSDVVKPGTKKVVKEAPESEPVEIEYSINGLNIGKLSYKIIKEAVLNEDETKLPRKAIDVLGKIFAETNPITQSKKAQELLDLAERKMAEISKIMWLHNASMFMIGGKTKVHTHNSKKWELNTSSRLKLGKEYIYKGKDAEGLVIKLKGLEI